MGQQNLNEASQDIQKGDFGEGAGRLEEQLLNRISESDDEGLTEGDGSKTGDEDAIAASSATETDADKANASVVSSFDINGKLALKEGDKVTKDHIVELERGWHRESDYTRKTQALAKEREAFAQEREAANEILAAREEIAKDPRALLNYFDPKLIVSAFTPQERLNLGLSSAGIAPETWNRFLDWMNESGEKVNMPKSDPYENRLNDYDRRWSKIEKRLDSWESNFQKQRETAIEQKNLSEFDSSVNQAIKDFPNLNKRKLLVEIAAEPEDSQRSVRQIAEAMHKEIEASEKQVESRFQQYVKNKKEKREVSVKPTKGSPVSVSKRQPQTFDEAEKMIAELYGDGVRIGQESL